MDGADVYIGVSGGTVPEEVVALMADEAVIFGLANPNPEVHPELAHRDARVVATGRSDFPNQINNVLAFPGIFRGAFDVHATAITEGMKLAAADALAGLVGAELAEDHIVPSPFDPRVGPAVSAAVADAARRDGVARRMLVGASASRGRRGASHGCGLLLSARHRLRAARRLRPSGGRGAASRPTQVPTRGRWRTTGGRFGAMFAVYADSFSPQDPLSGLVVGERPTRSLPTGGRRSRSRPPRSTTMTSGRCAGWGSRRKSLPMILGCDAAGYDEDGNEVVVHAVVSDPNWAGDETLDPKRSLLSERHQGTFAERVVVPRRNVVPKPASLSFEEAACLPTAWLTAYRMLFTQGGLKAGTACWCRRRRGSGDRADHPGPGRRPAGVRDLP